MLDYLKKYKELLELKKTIQKEIDNNELILDNNYQKWTKTKEKVENISLEIKILNKKYNEIKEKKEMRILDVVLIISLIISILTLIILAASIPFIVVFGPILAMLSTTIICMIVDLIIKTTPILQKYFIKDKTITNLLTQIKNKEKELISTNKLLNEYSKEIIKCSSKTKQLKEKKKYIEKSIDELLRNYAVPIFEEQLKNYQEESEKKDNQQPKTKTRKQ